MKKLVEAYTTLVDPEKRKLYDKQPQFQVRRFRRPERAARKNQEAAPAPQPTLMQKLYRLFRR